jgi:type I restriction enzyme S subunit
MVNRFMPVSALAVPKGLIGGPFGSSLGKRDYVASGVPVIRGQNLAGPGRFEADEFVYVSEEKASGELGRNLAKPGDVIFTQRGTLGQVGLVPDTGPDTYVISQSQMRLRVDPAVADARYVYYCFRDSRMQRVISSHAIVTGVPHINLGILAELEIPYRAVEEQSAIAEVLGALDDKIEINRRIAATSLELAVARYRLATASSPIMVKLGALGRWRSGGTPTTQEPSYWNGAIPWISASSLKSFFIDRSDRNVTEEGAGAGSRLVGPGTILFVVRGMSLKSEFRLGIAQRQVAFGQDCKAVIVDREWPHITVAVGLRAAEKEILLLVDEAGHGTGRLPTDLLREFEIAIPSPEPRQRVEAELESLVARGAEAERETEILKELRDTLLPALISGVLRVADGEQVVGEAV